jgi:PAS domain S-box-containing protein
MPLASILYKYQNRIVEEWIHHLHSSISQRYSSRPLDELSVTVCRANEASYAVLVNNDYSLIDSHIQWITRIRLEGGFSLSEVQNAYELYREILIPILLKELRGEELENTLRKLNQCLFYTITRFSDYFQSLHEQGIVEQSQNLQREVEKRTRDLAESEAEYRNLVEGINDGYFVNQNGRIVFSNQAFCDLHGYTLREMLGKSYTEIIAPKSIPMVRRLYEKRVTGAASKDLYIYLRRHKNGSALPTENKVKGIVYQGAFAVAGICRDITERIETEKRIRVAERFAHIGKLTTSLAHEIRNPLSSVKMNSQILLKNTDFNGNDKRRMEIVVNEISRLERILDEMLDFAKPLSLDIQRAAISKTIDSCLETMEVRIREKEIDIKKHYSRLRLRRMMFDTEKMEQAIINILINSMDVIGKGGRIEIRTRVLAQNGKSLRVEISDNGPGIAHEDLPYIFDPFFSSKKKGTGLGLANVKKIVEAHGGNVDVAPRKPSGVVLSLTLPIREEPA